VSDEHLSASPGDRLDPSPRPLELHTGSGGARRARNVVTRADGKLVNVNRQMGQLFVCRYGCCCGLESEGKPPGHYELYHEEWERRRIRNQVHLNMGGCLGPCPLANVSMLLFEGTTTFFHSMNTEQRIIDLYDYIETMIEAERYLPPPPALRDLAFSAFRNDGKGIEIEPAERAVEARPLTAASGGIVFLTHSDTDVLAVSAIAEDLDPQVPNVRVYNVGHLQDEADAAAFFEATVRGAEVVLVKLHGGAKSLPGFERLARLVEEEAAWLVAMPGIDDLDPELTNYSNAGAPIAHAARAYLQLGGLENYRQCLYFLCDHLLATGIGYDDPAEQPRAGVYHPRVPSGRIEDWRALADPARPTVGVTFYRSYWFSGDTDFVDTLVEAGEARGLNVLPVYAYSLKDEPDADGLPAAFRFFVEDGTPTVDAVVNTMAFAMGSSSMDDRHEGEWAVEVLDRLGIPQLQAMNASLSVERWRESEGGLPPLDVAMNVAIPELDGRIITVPASFKERSDAHSAAAGTPVVRRQLPRDRAERIMGIALRLARLRRTSNAEKRIAIMVTNHHAKAARLANAVGLDSPASVLALLHRMADAGYEVDALPPDPDALMAMLTERGHYDADYLTEEQLAGAPVHVTPARYREWFAALPEHRQAEMRLQWGEPPGEPYVDRTGALALPGLRFGNVFVAIQPPRGYGMDKTAIMHKPDLPPPYPYHALYRWLAEPSGDGGFGADAIVQMGKHGSLEWLPGKGIGLADDCYPDLFLGDLPVVYPFIIDGPGEGAAAKRRIHATIIDHLPPALTTAEAYGDLDQLDRLVDEYYLIERTDPAKLPVLQKQIWDLLRSAHLDTELEALLNADAAEDHVHEWDVREHADGVPYSISDLSGTDFAHLVEAVHTYTHEVGTAPLREGFHTLGLPPEGEALIDTLLMLVRLRNGSTPSLREALARVYAVDVDAVLAAPGTRLVTPLPALAGASGRAHLNDGADALGALDSVARALLERLAGHDYSPNVIDSVLAEVLGAVPVADGVPEVRAALALVCERLIPGLRQTDDELAHILDALEGRYVRPGPSGALTRGMAHALPTGRNFYAIDPRSLPTPTAWIVGQDLAAAVVERALADDGRVPGSVGLSIWGTAAMRTSGEDIAQVLALIGARPVWQGESRRVDRIEVIPLEELGRPRIDVVCRISGFFRDAFPDAIALLDEAFDRVSVLDEPADRNFIRAHRLAEQARLIAEGIDEDEAWKRAGYRVFGSAPGVYGTGILHLIDERNWETDEDFALTYVNWGGYAYTREEFGVDAREAFRSSLASVSVAVKNQDNREHDLFDSDDYLQFHGGMIATVRALTGRAPRRYFGDSSDPERPRVRDLKEEANRIFRSRVVNPKWIESMKRHGYRGATELTATMDYLFGYDATAQVVDDWQYEQVARSYLLAEGMAEFFAQSNPWAQRDIAERLLEAAQRGMWAEPDPEVRHQIEEALLRAEGDIEGRDTDTASVSSGGRS